MPSDLSHGLGTDLRWLSFSGEEFVCHGRSSARESEPFRHKPAAVPGRCHLAGGLGEALVGVQGEFKRRQRAGRFDEVADVVGQAGQHVVDHRRVGRAGGWQVNEPFPISSYFGRCSGAEEVVVDVLLSLVTEERDDVPQAWLSRP